VLSSDGISSIPCNLRATVDKIAIKEDAEAEILYGPGTMG
jgi:hypothetical protein